MRYCPVAAQAHKWLQLFLSWVGWRSRTPSIGVSIPNQAGSTTLLMDAGANVDCKASNLLQFAALGSSYASAVQGLSNPDCSIKQWRRSRQRQQC